MRARLIKVRKKKTVTPPDPVEPKRGRGRPPKVKLKGGGFTINRFSPAELWKRLQLPPTDKHYLSGSSLNSDIRRIIIYWAECVAHIPRFEVISTLGISAATYYSDTKETRDRSFILADETAVESLAHSIIENADRLAKQAEADGKNRDAWEIRKGAVEMLQSLGITFKSPDEHRIIEDWNFAGLLGKDVELESTTKVTVHSDGNGNGHGKTRKG